MKYIFVSFLLLFFSHQLLAQHFSGEIIYKIKVIPKNNNVDIDSILTAKRGTTISYLIKDGYYKSTHIDEGKPGGYSYTYHNDTKRMYDDYAEDREYITFRDSRKGKFTYKESKIYRDSIKTVLGHSCFMVSMESNYGFSKTYYSEDIKVDYEAFVDHKIGNWYQKLKDVDGCISMKTITEFPNHYEVQEAVEINPREIATSEFDLPASKMVVASSSALDKQARMIEPSREQLLPYFKGVKKGNKLLNKSEKVTSYISFVLTEKGEIKYAAPYEIDDRGFSKIAMDIFNSCGFQFSPGEIGGEAISSQVYFPVEFE